MKSRVTNLVRRKAISLARHGAVRLLSGRLPLYVVNEYPKSGGTWVGQMLGRALDVPYPRLSFPALKPSIIHTHYLQPGGMKNVVVVWRDGRDVMVSWYFHSLFLNKYNNGDLMNKFRKDLAFSDYEDIRENMPAFIDYVFNRAHYPRFSWSEFVRRWHAIDGVTYVRYEDLRQNTPGELQRIVGKLSGETLDARKGAEVVEEFSFARQTGRQPGVESKNSFLRKGTVGDWQNHFNQEARETFDRYAGNELLMLGYETDRMWLKDEPPSSPPSGNTDQ